MKLSANRIETFLASPPKDLPVILFYGPDEGLVRERATQLTKKFVPDLKDPFSYCELLGSDLTGQETRLSDEALSLSFSQNRRVIRLRQAGDTHTKSVTSLIATLSEQAGQEMPLVILEAGDLPPRSKLRSLCEKQDLAASVPCYRDDERNLRQLVSQHFAQEQISLSGDIIDYIVSLLGSDRGITRQELAKLSLYLYQKEPPITFEHIQACLGDSADIGLDDLCDAIGLGHLPKLDHILQTLSTGGVSAIQQLRAVSRHFQRLNQVLSLLQTGMPQAQAIKTLRPPLFFKKQASFQQQLPLWTPALTQKCLSKLVWAEDQTKMSGSAVDLITARVFLDITLQAYRQRRQRR